MATEQAQRGSLVLRGTGNVPYLLSRLCGGDLGMSRKSKAFLMSCVLQGCEASSLPVLGLERGSCQWQGWTGGAGGGTWSLCGAAAGQPRALNQLQTSWLHSAVGMLSGDAGSPAGRVRWRAAPPSSERSTEHFCREGGA